MSASLIQKPSTNVKASALAEPTQVGAVVQEYMDSLLVDLFPDIEVPVESPILISETDIQTKVAEQEVIEVALEEPEVQVKEDVKLEVTTETSLQQTIKSKLNLSDPLTQVLMKVAALIQTRKTEAAPVIALEPEAPEPEVQEQKKVVADTAVTTITHVKEEPEPALESTKDLTIDDKADVTIESLVDVDIPAPQDIDQTSTQLETAIQQAEPLKYPKAPVWAQEAFDVLLFDICGLKLAVPMESLGRIIKMDHETNQLIGRPDWFLGAYTDAEQHFYAVDTAQYIMPEQKIDLVKEGFGFLIQLQKTQWTLACQHVHSTVRLEPGDVKWRSQEGWFAGTLVEHMCALLHVDSLVGTLEADSR